MASEKRAAEHLRGWVALILAGSVGVGVLLLTAAALLDVLYDPDKSEISPAYVALVQTTLGVLVGGLVGYLGGAARGGDEHEEPEEAP